MTRIAMLHPGAMGGEIGAALVAIGHEVVWLPKGRSTATQRRAAEAGMVAAANLEGCALVLSVVPPAAALETARSVAAYGGHFVDANAISPPTAREVARIVTEGGATYTDGGIIGGPPTTAGTTRLYLSGEHAPQVAQFFDGARIEARVVEAGGPTAASALKMTYAAWTKISAALLLSARLTAAELGVEEALAQEWALSQPDLDARWRSAGRSAASKGWRWTAEMREIARTFASAGQPAGFGQAAAELYERFARPDS
jgi:3-hydroxyisobutyrate dehydrogenase-like beta-hydroxyacid dehydrogenase